MEYFYTIKDADIFGDPAPEPKEYTVRPTSKGFVFDDEGRVCLLNVGSLFGLPGGGIEEGETPEQAFIRECKEEIGCFVEIISSVGTVLQTKAKQAKKYEIHYFVGKVIGEKGKPEPASDTDTTFTFEWHPESELLSIFENQLPHIPKENYVMQFNGRTHLAALKKHLGTKN
jgi:8-oxo-dGTP diphosphatase